ncbi:MAG: HD domain-containing phosphohydrolase [Candidatus Omnitrophota bacterium]
MKIRLAAKFAGLATISILFVAMLFSFYLISHERSLLTDQLQERGISIARGIANNCQLGIMAEDMPILENFIRGALLERDIISAEILRNDGKVLAHSDRQQIGAAREDISGQLNAYRISYLSSDTYRIEVPVSLIPEEFTPFGVTTSGEEEIIGFVRLGITMKNVDMELAAMRQRIIFITAMIIICGFIVSILIAHRISRPLRLLVEVVNKVAKGDFLQEVKPSTSDEVRELSVAFNEMAKELKKSRDKIEGYSHMLEDKVRERTKRLQETYLHTVTSLVSAIDAKDTYTRNHSESVSHWAVLVAQEMGLTPAEIQSVRLAGQLHDVGKIGIEDKILTKPGKLTPEEWEVMKTHSEKAAEILAPLDFLKDAARIVEENHEHYDGKGYPHGKKGDEISLGARIVAVADAYDTMTSKRPYRDMLPKEKVMEELAKSSGSQFDPSIINVFIKLIKEGKIPYPKVN